MQHTVEKICFNFFSNGTKYHWRIYAKIYLCSFATRKNSRASQRFSELQAFFGSWQHDSNLCSLLSCLLLLRVGRMPICPSLTSRVWLHFRSTWLIQSNTHLKVLNAVITAKSLVLCGNMYRFQGFWCRYLLWGHCSAHHQYLKL